MALNQDIDNEWANFISSTYDEDDISSDGEETNEILQQTTEEFISANLSADMDSEAPKSTNIYISTKTKIAYFFWCTILIVKKLEPHCNGIKHADFNFNLFTIFV